MHKKDLMSRREKKCLVVLERGPMLLVASLMMRVYLLAVCSDGKPLLVQLDKIELSNVPSASFANDMEHCVWNSFLLVCLFPPTSPTTKFFCNPQLLRHLSPTRYEK